MIKNFTQYKLHVRIYVCTCGAQKPFIPTTVYTRGELITPQTVIKLESQYRYTTTPYLHTCEVLQ